MLYFRPILGIVLIIGLAWALSENRRVFPRRTVVAGLLVQLGLAAIVPERRAELAQLGLKSILAGTMATCMTGAIAGLLFW
ncbi:MAG: hypothetical protein OXD50_05035 [Chloroflexi bacterium]|nr:hypothetical protein [Chloroflexota bacterium]